MIITDYIIMIILYFVRCARRLVPIIQNLNFSKNVFFFLIFKRVEQVNNIICNYFLKYLRTNMNIYGLLL